MPRLLVVEDNKKHMRWLIDVLQKRGEALGYEIAYHTTNWRRAGDLIRTKAAEFDVLVTDLQDTKSRRFRGLGLIQQARDKGKGVIAVSSFLDDEAHMQDVLKSRANFYVKKPFKPQWRTWEEYAEELHRSAELSMYFALRRFSEDQSITGEREKDVFLSYSTKDKKLASQLRDALKARKVSCFMAGKDIRVAAPWEPRIKRAIIGSRLVLLLITPNSKASRWVLAEAGAAWGLSKLIVPAFYKVQYAELPELITKHQGLKIVAVKNRRELVSEIRRLLSGDT